MPLHQVRIRSEHSHPEASHAPQPPGRKQRQVDDNPAEPLSLLRAETDLKTMARTARSPAWPLFQSDQASLALQIPKDKNAT